MSSAAPHDRTAEVATLGALLIRNEALYDLPAEFRAEDFYFRQHLDLFAVVAEMVTGGKPADEVTLIAELKARAMLDAVGGVEYVVALRDACPSASVIDRYAGIVQQHARRRRLIHAHHEATQLAQDELVPLDELQGRIEELLLAAQIGEAEGRIRERDVVRRLVQEAQQRERGDLKSKRAVRFGIGGVDQALTVHESDVVVVAADTGGGKSVMLSQFARANGVGPEARPVLVASLEMGEDELGYRRLMDVASLDYPSLVRPVGTEAAQRLIRGADVVVGTSQVEYLRSYDLAMILREGLRMKRKHGLAALVLDYLQILDFPSSWGGTRDQQIGKATRMMKRFAAENRVPVIVASQLRKRENGRAPTKEDLRESGNIGNDANAVVILDIPGLVEGTPEHKNGDKRTARCLIAKQRMGQANVFIPLVAEFEHARFVDRDWRAA